MSEVTIAPPRPEDKPDWRRLFEGYATFYERPMNDAIADRVWDPRWTQAVVFGLLVVILIFRPTGLLGEETTERA